MKRAFLSLVSGILLLAPVWAQSKLSIEELAVIAQSQLDLGDIGYRCRSTRPSEFSDFHEKLAKAAIEGVERGDAIFLCAPYVRSGKYGIRDGGAVVIVSPQGQVRHSEFVL